MTAAAIRPELFSHLFASRRGSPEKGDMFATGVSIVLHAAAVLGLVWASASIIRDEPTISERTVPIIIAGPRDVPITQAPARSDGGNPGVGVPQPPLAVPDPTQPIASTPSGMSDPWFEPAPTPGSPGGNNPGATSGDEPGTRGGVIVSSSIPALLNASEVRRTLERTYPAILRDAGIGGQVMVWLLIDENGRVAETEVKERSGHAALDQAALNVAEMMRFSPARQDDRKVRIWVAIPIRFTTR